MSCKLINKTIFVKKKSQENAMKFVSFIVLSMVETLAFLFCLKALKKLVYWKKQQQKLSFPFFSVVNKQETIEKFNSHKSDEKYSKLIEFLFFSIYICIFSLFDCTTSSFCSSEVAFASTFFSNWILLLHHEKTYRKWHSLVIS